MKKNEMNDIVAKAIIKRRNHECDLIEDTSKVFVQGGVHTQWDIHRVDVDIDGITVMFWRYRQHSPCRNHSIKEIDPPYGYKGLCIEAEGRRIIVQY